MKALSNQNQPTLRLSQLAATVIVCWSIGSYTHILSSNTFNPSSQRPSQVAPDPDAASSKGPRSKALSGIAVLDARDAALYEAIFEAQAAANWAKADALIGKIQDRRLVGHVLADRYFRAAPKLRQLEDWLAAYGDLPQAPALYAKASHMPEAKGAKLPRPVSTTAWAALGGFGASVHFKAEDDETLTLSPQGRQIQSKVSKALRKGQTSLAVDLLEDVDTRDVRLDPKEKAGIYARVAASLYYGGVVGEARRIAEPAMRQAHPLGLWISGLAAWEQADFEGAAAAFTALASLSGLADWDRAAADFWAYRSLRRAGENEQAYQWLRHAAGQPRTFYGFLANNLLGREQEWSWDMPTLDKAKIALLTKRPEGARALALAQIGQRDMAETELRRLNPQGQKALAHAMMAFAEAEQMPALVLRLGGFAVDGYGTAYDGAMYPIPLWRPTQGYSVEPSLIYALMRRESLFDPAAVSVSGACGLMQLMPATAKLAASTLRGNFHSATYANDNALGSKASPCAGHLLDPVTNVTLGQSYVRHLTELAPINDNLLLLLAAYNGGPGRLSRWVEEAAEKDPLLFLESLPVRETREYVQQVLVHYWTYSARLGQPQTSLAQLARGEWPRLAPYAPTSREAAVKSKRPLAVVADSGFQAR